MRGITVDTRWLAVFIGFLLTAFFLWIAISPPHFVNVVLQRLDYITYDLRLNVLLDKNPSPKNPIVIVDIDEKSLKAEGRWPWSRNKLTQLVNQLYAQGATVIAFDILFSEPESNVATLMINQLQQQNLASIDVIQHIQALSADFDYDKVFSHALAQGKDRIVLGLFLSADKSLPVGELPKPAIDLTQINATDITLPSMQSYIGNIAILQHAANAAGALSVIPDQDGTIRRYSLVQRYGNNLYDSLALEAVRLYLLVPEISLSTTTIGKHKIINSINLGQAQIATDEDGRVFIPYLGPAQTFPYYSASDVIQGKLPAHQLQNALVFVGTSAVGLGDMRSAPVQSVYPGVEIHANIAEALFSNRFPYIPAWAPGAQLVILIFCGLLLSILFAFIGPLWIIAITVLMIAVVFLSSLWLWQSGDIVLPIVLSSIEIAMLSIFNLAFGFLTESRRRYELKKVFEQYVPSARVAEIIKHPDAVSSFEGERKIMSVLFMDIRNFTTISEKLGIADLKKLLNFFLTEMTGVIFKHGGTIDKYVGDMIMAFWGAPLSDLDHAKHALLAGLDMQTTTNKLQEKLIAMGLPNIRIGIGINTGMMDVGDMGSTFRRAYTVLGDAVNLASRLESLTKYYGVGMIVGEKTIEGQDEFIFRQLDKVKVKGKHEGICIYQPVGLRANIKKETLLELEHYENALSAYMSGEWVDAEKLFAELQTQYPDVILYQLYSERIKTFIAQPPSENWDGVWEHHEK